MLIVIAITMFVVACVLTLVMITLTVYMAVTWNRKPKPKKIPFVIDKVLDHDIDEGFFLGIQNNIPELLAELEKEKQ
jgi:hypothetical protein